MSDMRHQFDYLVLGSGIAGLSFAVQAARHGSVALLAKRSRSESNTAYAQGGIAAVFGPQDSFDQHIHDTLVAGGGLCREEAVRVTVTEGPTRVRELIELGAEFTRDASPFRARLPREGGRPQRRVVHAADLTGMEVERTLLGAAAAAGVQFFEDHHAIDLILASKLGASSERVVGAYALDTRSGHVHSFVAKAVVLATGGAGKVYLYTTNPDVATGDGLAMAYRAGAQVANLEFVQFHPTCLYHPRAKSFLLSEALRGEGARLRTLDGTRFMPLYHRQAELAPRDVVARAIDREMKRRGEPHVWLDISHRPGAQVRARFPNIAAALERYGLDLTREPIPVVPAAHYMCGGVIAKLSGRTALDGLFAIGEVACTGLHGANRLASNSLLEALVGAHRAAADVR